MISGYPFRSRQRWTFKNNSEVNNIQDGGARKISKDRKRHRDLDSDSNISFYSSLVQQKRLSLQKEKKNIPGLTRFSDKASCNFCCNCSALFLSSFS